VKKTDLKVEVETSTLPEKLVTTFRESENSMIASDKLIADTQEKKNNLEEYIYDMRNKISGEYGKYIQESVKEDFMKQLTQNEDWLYNEGEGAGKSVFVERLEALKKIGVPMVERYNEAENRPKAISDFKTTINQLRNAAQSWDEKYSHIEEAEKAKIVDKCAEKEKWLDEQVAKQEKLAPYEPPVLRAASIYAERESLVTFSTSILNKPKPKPKTEEPPKTEEAKKEEAPKPEAEPKQEQAPEKEELDLNSSMDVD